MRWQFNLRDLIALIMAISVVCGAVRLWGCSSLPMTLAVVGGLFVMQAISQAKILVISLASGVGMAAGATIVLAYGRYVGRLQNFRLEIRPTTGVWSDWEIVLDHFIGGLIVGATLTIYTAYFGTTQIGWCTKEGSDNGFGSLGRAFQMAALAVPVLAVVVQLGEAIHLGQMLGLFLAAVCLFWIGRVMEAEAPDS